MIGDLDTLVGLQTWPEKGFVYTGTGKAAIADFSKAKRRIDAITQRTAPNFVKPWRLHDVRRSVATNLQRLGVRFEVTEAVLNHVSITQSGLAGVYQRYDWSAEKRDALERWTNRLKQLVTDPPEVLVPFLL